MICPKCKNVGILNTVLGKDFYYCRTCKEEILLEEVKTSTHISDPQEYILDDFLDVSSWDVFEPY